MEILEITLIGGKRYSVGSTTNDRIVGQIKENSIEWDNYIDWIYEVYDQDGVKMAEIRNVGAEIVYKK